MAWPIEGFGGIVRVRAELNQRRNVATWPVEIWLPEEVLTAVAREGVEGLAARYEVYRTFGEEVLDGLGQLHNKRLELRVVVDKVGKGRELFVEEVLVGPDGAKEDENVWVALDEAAKPVVKCMLMQVAGRGMFREIMDKIEKMEEKEGEDE